MEHMNDGPAPVSGSAGQSSGGIFMGEYGDVGMGVGVGVGVGVSSMMALMTQHQDPNDGASFSAFQGQPECLLSAAAMFQNQSASASASASDHKLKQQQAFATSVKAEPGAHQLEFRSNSSSSRPSQDDQQGENSSSLPWMFAPASAADSDDAMKAKIVAHPQYPALLAAYIDCQKVGASPEIATRLEAIGEEYRGRQRRAATVVGMDPELDQFMEAYCEMLAKYHEELIKPFNEAMSFFKKVESQLSSITKGAVRISPPDADDKTEGGSSEEDGSCCETEQQEVLDQHVEERDLKDHLLRKFGGRLGPLKQEFMKKKKKGKLPKDARQKLLDWWNHHYKWPYPSEPEKIALAESTGLDQKQINNWFINQRKRHWKPSEDMQFVVMDHAAHAHAHAHAAGAALYVEAPPPGYHHHHHHHHHHHLDC